MGAGFPAPFLPSILGRRRKGGDSGLGEHFYPQQCPLQHYLWPHPPLPSRLKGDRAGGGETEDGDVEAGLG